MTYSDKLTAQKSGNRTRKHFALAHFGFTFQAMPHSDLLPKILPISGVIKHYDWGSRNHIPALVGVMPDGQPHAELWLGAHRSGSATTQLKGQSQELFELIATHPQEMLGREVFGNSGARLPFLMKFLGIEKPLSVQVHPTIEQARTGFERENGQGLPLNDPARTYVDSYDKPELICALTEISALCGFRSVDETAKLIEPLSSWLHCEHELPGDNFLALFELPRETQNLIIQSIPGIADSQPESQAWQWVARLAQARAHDVSVLAPLFLNLVTLRHHEALFLDAGTIHAYLEGFGVEVMGSSDNVVRGGLTSKHVNLDELAIVLNKAATPAMPLSAHQTPDGWLAWPSGCDYFRLMYSDTTSDDLDLAGPAVVMCFSGQAQVRDTDSAAELHAGQSLFIAGDSSAKLRVSGEIYVCEVNRHAAVKPHGIAQ